MDLKTIIEMLGNLENARLYRAPKDIKVLAEPWYEKFKTMSENQFKFAIEEIINKETTFPAIAIIYRYAENWQESYRKKTCPYCFDTGLLLIKNQNKHIAYACCCEIGRKRQQNMRIAPFESLGIPWDEMDEGEVSPNRKMTEDNRRKIDGFLDNIGQKMSGESG